MGLTIRGLTATGRQPTEPLCKATCINGWSGVPASSTKYTRAERGSTPYLTESSSGLAVSGATRPPISNAVANTPAWNASELEADTIVLRASSPLKCRARYLSKRADRMTGCLKVACPSCSATTKRAAPSPNRALRAMPSEMRATRTPFSNVVWPRDASTSTSSTM